MSETYDTIFDILDEEIEKKQVRLGSIHDRNARIAEAAREYVELHNKFLDWAHKKIELPDVKKFFGEFNKSLADLKILIQDTAETGDRG